MRFVRLRFDGLPPTWLQPDGLYCRASDAYHLKECGCLNSQMITPTPNEYFANSPVF